VIERAAGHLNEIKNLRTQSKSMTDSAHVKAFRLFELSCAEREGKHLQLEAWENIHLQDCAECRGVVEVFASQFKGRPLQLPDRSSPPQASQRFKVGDEVEVIGPGDNHLRRGTVTQVIEPTTGDFVYRYSVDFDDAASATFFGFELLLAA
jgi:hypothetical protein